mmetsp:Transcript_33655/g.89464  ORF Transcript_33655/g.89464 Transcript_33655/m.89464 type:complete len:233 (+) Transcript_33655:401-1099(+)
MAAGCTFDHRLEGFRALAAFLGCSRTDGSTSRTRMSLGWQLQRLKFTMPTWKLAGGSAVSAASAALSSAAAPRLCSARSRGSSCWRAVLHPREPPFISSRTLRRPLNGVCSKQCAERACRFMGSRCSGGTCSSASAWTSLGHWMPPPQPFCSRRSQRSWHGRRSQLRRRPPLGARWRSTSSRRPARKTLTVSPPAPPLVAQMDLEATRCRWAAAHQCIATSSEGPHLCELLW